MLKEFDGDVLVNRVPVCEQQRHLKHIEAELCHPGRAVGLLKNFARKDHRAVERANIVEPQKAALENIIASRVLAVDPPCKVDQQLVEDACEEIESP